MLIPLLLLALTANLDLSCVSKIGEDMYQAMDGTVVWTEACLVKAECVSATVRFEPRPTLLFREGKTCRVVKVALPSKED